MTKDELVADTKTKKQYMAYFNQMKNEGKDPDTWGKWHGRLMKARGAESVGITSKQSKSQMSNLSDDDYNEIMKMSDKRKRNAGT
jgi:hypothetical protein